MGPRPAQLIVLKPESAKLCTEFPDQMGPLVLICTWGKPQAVFCVQVPL